MKEIDLGDVLGWGKKECADMQARAFLGLYQRTGNGIFIWHAYMRYRCDGVAVPEWVLVLVDRVAKRLLQAKGQSAIAAALEMSNAKGGPQGVAAARKVLRVRPIVEHVHWLLQDNRVRGRKARGRLAIYAIVAKRFHKTPKQVGDIYRAWFAASGPRK